MQLYTKLYSNWNKYFDRREIDVARLFWFFFNIVGDSTLAFDIRRRGTRPFAESTAS